MQKAEMKECKHEYETTTVYRLEGFPSKKIRLWAVWSTFGIFQSRKMAIDAGRFGVKKGILTKPKVVPVEVVISFSQKTGLKDLGWIE